MREYEDGDFVLATDYDALAAAARDLDCYWCRGTGKFLGTEKDCDRCADLCKELEGTT